MTAVVGWVVELKILVVVLVWIPFVNWVFKMGIDVIVIIKLVVSGWVVDVVVVVIGVVVVVNGVCYYSCCWSQKHILGFVWNQAINK